MSSAELAIAAAGADGAAAPERLRILCIISFLNEERYLRRFLASLARQERPADLLLLVDDGSSDDSAQIAAEFARSRSGVAVLSRPAQVRARDRLAQAAELRSFQWALATLEGRGPGAEPAVESDAAGGGERWDVIAKIDADLELAPELLQTLEHAFLTTPELGIAGTYLSVVDPRTGLQARERCPPEHVRGATKFYRRACLQEISPVPAILGWDTIDEIAARRHGWTTASFACSRGETLHLRPTGAIDGRLRAQYRWGACAYGIGQHPLWVLLSAVRRLGDRPLPLGACAFLAGWAAALVRRRPRAPAEIRAFGRSEQLSSLGRRVRSVLPA